MTHPDLSDAGLDELMRIAGRVLQKWPREDESDQQMVAMADGVRALVQEVRELRAHITKLCEIFDDAVPCNDHSCQLMAILSWVDPADKQRVHDMRDRLREQLSATERARDEAMAANERLRAVVVCSSRRNETKERKP